MVAFLRDSCFILFLCLLWLVVLVPVCLLLPFCVVMFILKKNEELIYKFLYGAMHFKIEETPWLHDGPKNRANINCLLMLESYLDIKTFRKIIDKKLISARDPSTGKLLYPRVTKYVHAGFLNFYWNEETNFQLSDHVYEWSKNPCKSKAELEDLVSTFAERPLRTMENHSPWEFILIHCKDSDGHKRSSILVRTSHALADGTSLMYFLINQLCEDSKNNQYLSGTEFKLTVTEKFLIRLKSCLYFPYNIARSIIPKHKRVTSLDCLNLSGKKRMVYSQPIQLELIKSIKRQLNVTVNDVMLGCLATSIHNYFRKRNEKAPKDFFVCVPVDTRLGLDEAKEFSNKINITQIPLPCGDGDPVQNIYKVHEQMLKTKSNLEGMSLRFGLRLAATFAPNFLIQYIIRTSVRTTSMVVSNVQGPSNVLKLAGKKMTYLVFWPPGKDHIGSSISIFSYNGSIYMGASSDVNVCENPKQILEDLPHIVVSLAESLDSKN